MPSTSPASTASAKRPRTSCSRLESGSAARSRPVAGRRDANAARARLSRLFTDGSVIASIAATSPARNPSTSRSTSTARCCGGRCCSPATNASAVASFAS